MNSNSALTIYKNVSTLTVYKEKPQITIKKVIEIFVYEEQIPEYLQPYLSQYSYNMQSVHDQL